MRFYKDKLELGRVRLPYIGVILFLLGLGLRVWQFGSVPGGLNQDEASIGYEAWSLLHYGIDRNGIQLPVHLIAWGSGQNALYAYLSMPFIALMGLSVASVRMVNLLFGLLSILLVFLILNKIAGKRCAYIGMALMAIAPWGIMISRWGLEANLFPGLFLLAFYLLLVGLEKPRFLVLAAAVLALCLYSYGAAYVMVPAFCLLAAFFLAVESKVPPRYLVASVLCFVIVAVPIGLFVLTNLFHWGDIRLLCFTVPEMTGVARIFTATQPHTILQSMQYFFNNVILQQDGMISNAVAGYGTIFPMTLPFVFVGGYAALRSYRRSRKEPGARPHAAILLLAWLLAALLLFLVYAWTNINRVNIVYPVLILFAALGLDRLCRDAKTICAIGLCYAVMLGGFAAEYFGPYAHAISVPFYASFGDAIIAAEELAEESEPVYVTAKVDAAYIFALFYMRTPPQEYIDSVLIANKEAEFQSVSSYGRYIFNVDSSKSGEKGLYILTNDELATMIPSGAEVLRAFENYSVARVG